MGLLAPTDFHKQVTTIRALYQASFSRHPRRSIKGLSLTSGQLPKPIQTRSQTFSDFSVILETIHYEAARAFKPASHQTLWSCSWSCSPEHCHCQHPQIPLVHNLIFFIWCFTMSVIIAVTRRDWKMGSFTCIDDCMWSLFCPARQASHFRANKQGMIVQQEQFIQQREQWASTRTSTTASQVIHKWQLIE